MGLNGVMRVARGQLRPTRHTPPSIGILDSIILLMKSRFYELTVRQLRGDSTRGNHFQVAQFDAGDLAFQSRCDNRSVLRHKYSGFSQKRSSYMHVIAVS